MPSSSAVTVTVPATTANLGPGFDCIGAALTLYNSFTFTALDSSSTELLRIAVTGLEAERVQTDTRNLAYQSFSKFYQHLGQTPPPVAIEIALGIPLARGLGSSATAIVAGLVAADYFTGLSAGSPTLIELAIDLEGHPDNVVPALLGGCRLAASHSQHPTESVICDVPWDEQVVPIVAIPDFELSTQEARRVLPSEYSRADAIFNTAHLGLLVRGLATGQADWLRSALQDRIHQPYRQVLIPGYADVQAAALAAGAYGLVISGAGPTLLSLSAADQVATINAAMVAAWATHGITAQALALRLDRQGTRTEPATKPITM
jgi:homoserine kinase